MRAFEQPRRRRHLGRRLVESLRWRRYLCGARTFGSVDRLRGVAERVHLAHRHTHHDARFHRPVMEDMSDTPISKLDYRFNWSSPIAVSSTDPNTLYIGANVVFKSTDGGKNWQPISKDLTRDIKEHQPVSGEPVFHDISSAENSDTLLSISLSDTDPNVIWVGTDDGLVWVSKDGGANWANVSTGLPQAVSLGRIYQIGVSPFDAGTAYIAVDGHMLGDEHPYVLKTSDYGAHWQSISNGLPDGYAAVVVREDPNRK